MMMRLVLLVVLLAPQQADEIKISIEAAQRRFNPDGSMLMKFTIENLSGSAAELPEPADWADGIEVRDSKNNIVKASGTAKDAKRTHTVDGRGFVGRTVDIAKVFAGKQVDEGMYTFRWSWMGRTTGEMKVVVLRDYLVKMETNFGDFTLELYPDSAPYHVMHFLELVRAGKYDKNKFHRIVPGFVIQAGRIGPMRPLAAEFNDRKHTLGTLAAARGPDPNSATSEFYITLATEPALDGLYTIFGQVKEGVESVQEIGKVQTDHSPCAGCGKRLGAGQANGHCGNHHQDAPVVDVVIKKASVVEPKK